MLETIILEKYKKNMETKKTKNKKQSTSSGWKDLVHGFVGNMLEQIGDNVSQKMHVWMLKFKRRAIGSVLLVLGATYFLTGLSDYANSVFGKNIPGIGAILVGLIVISIGYLLSRE